MAEGLFLEPYIPFLAESLALLNEWVYGKD